MPSATLTSKGQITIPKIIREHFHLQPGDRLEFILEDDKCVVVQPAKIDISELKGILSHLDRPMLSDEEMDEAITRQICEDNL